MRVGIGAVIHPTGGPARYACELAAALGRIRGSDEIVVFTNRPESFAEADHVEVVAVPLHSAIAEPLWDHVHMPEAARRARLDVYHGVKGAIPLALGCPKVVTIHDLAVYACPETFAWQQHLHMRPHLRLSALLAARVIADSEHARGDIHRRLRIPAERIDVVPLAVRHDLFRAEAGDDDEEIARRLGLPPRFFLYTGTLQPRKNIDVVVRAHARLADLEGWQLVIAGRVRPDFNPWWLAHPPDRVRVLAAPSDDELAVVYRRAAALVSPSSYEGFGLTFLEAMASGCPVVGTDVTSLPEVVGDAGILLEDPDEGDVAEAMRVLATDEPLRQDLRRRGIERAARFQWDETARQTMTVYREAVVHG